MTISDLEYEFLEEILTSVEGVGRQTAGKVISRKDEFEEFQSLPSEDISDVQYLGEEAQREIKEEFEDIDFQEDVRILYVERIIEGFLRTQYTNVRSISLDGLDINVLLIRALGFTSAEEVIQFYLYQRVTRSVVTSWGSGALEQLCRVTGSEKIPKKDNVRVEGKAFDVRKEKNDEEYYIQIKSGPNTMNVGMVDSLNEMIDKIEEKHDDAIGMLGMTYGKEAQVSSQIRRNLNDFDEKALIGKEFWEFLSGDEDYYFNLIAEIDRISKQFEEEFQQSFFEMVQEKQEELENSWCERYDGTGEEALDEFVDRYTA